MSKKWLDIVLVGVVLVSLGFIANRLFLGKRPEQGAPRVAAAPDARPNVSQSGQPGRPEPENLPKRGDFATISDESWKALSLQPPFKGAAVSRTKGCDSLVKKSNLMSAYSTNFEINMSKYLSGELDYFIGVSDESCFVKGQEILIYLAPPTAPYSGFQVKARARVKEIYVFPADQLSEEFVRLSQMPRGLYDDWRTASVRPDDRTEVIVRFEKLVPTVTAPTIVPPTFFRIPLVDAATVKAWKASAEIGPRLRVMDIRSQAEFQKSNFPGSTNVPYRLEGFEDKVPPMGVPVATLVAAQFDVFSVLVDQKDYIVLVGSDRNDARAFYALSDLQRFTSRKHVYWLYDGVSSLLK